MMSIMSMMSLMSVSALHPANARSAWRARPTPRMAGHVDSPNGTTLEDLVFRLTHRQVRDTDGLAQISRPLSGAQLDQTILGRYGDTLITARGGTEQNRLYSYLWLPSVHNNQQVERATALAEALDTQAPMPWHWHSKTWALRGAIRVIRLFAPQRVVKVRTFATSGHGLLVRYTAYDPPPTDHGYPHDSQHPRRGGYT
ncbi:MAG: hypothetical protein KC475_11000 [Cyanobacteria bacterium HKST-UBA03]|nr:hypothetical protein [Cyanobacteria bacterium HKST-UBA03]